MQNIEERLLPVKIKMDQQAANNQTQNLTTIEIHDCLNQLTRSQSNNVIKSSNNNHQGSSQPPGEGKSRRARWAHLSTTQNSDGGAQGQGPIASLGNS